MLRGDITAAPNPRKINTKSSRERDALLHNTNLLWYSQTADPLQRYKSIHMLKYFKADEVTDSEGSL